RRPQLPRLLPRPGPALRRAPVPADGADVPPPGARDGGAGRLHPERRDQPGVVLRRLALADLLRPVLAAGSDQAGAVRDGDGVDRPRVSSLERLRWNTHAFAAGKRKKDSPSGLLGLKLPPGGWWRLIQMTPEQLRRQLSALNPTARDDLAELCLHSLEITRELKDRRPQGGAAPGRH